MPGARLVAFETSEAPNDATITSVIRAGQIVGTSDGRVYVWLKAGCLPNHGRPEGPIRVCIGEVRILVGSLPRSSRRHHVPSRGVRTALLSRVGCSIKLPMLAGGR